MTNHPNRARNLTAQFLSENNITVESILYVSKNREVIVEHGLCFLQNVSGSDFCNGIAARQHEIGKHLDVKIV